MTRLQDLYDQQGQSPGSTTSSAAGSPAASSSAGSTAASGASRRTRRSSRRPSSGDRLRRRSSASSSAAAPRSRTPTGTWSPHDIQDGAAPSCARSTTPATAIDGYVSVEVAPASPATPPAPMARPATSTSRSTEPNLYVKIPGTAEGLPAIQQMITEGRSINVTLIFSLERYAEVIEAYLAGLEAADGDLSAISSVASFFVSRVDTEVDRRLDDDRHRPRRWRSRARPRWPRPSSPTSSSSSASRAPAGRRWPPAAPACSGRCGPRRRPRTRPSRHALRRHAHRAGHGQHHARRHPRRVRRPRHARPHRRRRPRRRPTPCIDALAEVGRRPRRRDPGARGRGRRRRSASPSTSCSTSSRPRPTASPPERRRGERHRRQPRAGNEHERVARRRRRRPRRVRRAGHRGVPRPTRTTASPWRCRAASTARRCYERLAADGGTQIDWWKVDVYWGDERCVPLDDPRLELPPRPRGAARPGRRGQRHLPDALRGGRRPVPAPPRRARPVRPRPPRARPRRPHRLAVPRLGGARRRPGPPRRHERGPARPQPVPADDPHLRPASPGPAWSSSRSRARTSARRWPGSRPATTCPPARIDADRVVWLVDPAAAGRPRPRRLTPWPRAAHPAGRCPTCTGWSRPPIGFAG